ncbi:MAG TPA: glucosaminidase domain-containing protein [Longilinea sp.]|nr:glucosaminidase domain-containing protein [Longilinea sp.]
MILSTNMSHAAGGNALQKPSLSTAVEHMTGMLWYEMLSAMNENGMDANALGAGGGDFQSMFLWNMAQNNFGKYNSALLAATMRQVGGNSTQAPDTASSTSSPLAQLLPANTGTEIQSPAVATPAGSAQPAGDIISQAKTFAQSIWPQITKAAQALGVPPVAVLAQTALETGWGTSAAGNNLFGVKATGNEDSSVRGTHEMVDGVLTPQTASFRNYDNVADSVSDYVGLIQAGFGAAAGQKTVAGFAQALQDGGYATDTSYAAKIVGISQSPLMAQVLQAIGSSPSTTSTPGTP